MGLETRMTGSCAGPKRLPRVALWLFVPIALGAVVGLASRWHAKRAIGESPVVSPKAVQPTAGEIMRKDVKPVLAQSPATRGIGLTPAQMKAHEDAQQAVDAASAAVSSVANGSNTEAGRPGRSFSVTGC
jgi:hypothetical protein